MENNEVGCTNGDFPDKKGPIKFTDLIYALVSCLTKISPIVILIGLTCFSLIGVYAYYTFNTNFLGLVGPDFSEYIVIGSYEGFSDSGTHTWKITYEYEDLSVFEGVVRKVYPIRENSFPILTHDILVTTGDYANEKLVDVSVFHHRFRWSSQKQPPLGTINLLHTVPMNNDIYEELLSIKTNDTVKITGREILRIDAMNKGDSTGWWEDDGCNTMIVTDVEIIK